jgi:phage/plasmid-associated DNA primase
MANAYLNSTPDSIHNYIIWRGAGGNGKSLLSQLFCLAFPEETEITQLPQNKAKGKIKTIFTNNVSPVSAYRVFSVLDKVTVINCVNMYPKIKYFDITFYRTMRVIPFTSEFVEESLVCSEKHMYLRKSFTNADLLRLKDELKALLTEIYDNKKDYTIPSAVLEENEGCKLFSQM